MAFEPTDEYLAILRDAREQIVYLNELGVESLDTGNVAGERPAKRKTTSASIPVAASVEPEAKTEIARSRTGSANATSLLFEDALLPRPTLPKTSETFEQIHAEIGDCTRCPLYKERTNIVHTDGNHKARLMFVGEAPGADEDR